MAQTKVLAVLGFKKEIDWMRSASFEVQVLGSLLTDKFDTKGIKKIKDTIVSEGKPFTSEFGFRMEINETYRFPRKHVNR